MGTKVFNDRIKSDYPLVLINGKKFDVHHLANYVIPNLLPDMYRHNEFCFYWHFQAQDINALDEQMYETERKRMIQNELSCENFEDVWTAYFQTRDGTRMMAEITNEVWHKEDHDNPMSPFAFVFDYPLCDGYFISKVKFLKV